MTDVKKIKSGSPTRQIQELIEIAPIASCDDAKRKLGLETRSAASRRYESRDRSIAIAN